MGKLTRSQNLHLRSGEGHAAGSGAGLAADLDLPARQVAAQSDMADANSDSPFLDHQYSGEDVAISRHAIDAYSYRGGQRSRSQVCYRDFSAVDCGDA